MNFARKLLDWYWKNKRDLPWRNTKDPYRIWLSEIILQQTRIEQGLPYYLKFTETYPTVKDLARAYEQSVLKLWQGLGYYTRARNLHLTAKVIQQDHLGKFPDTYQAIRNLKGVGDYTAGAIASIAFNLPYPAVDGNVMRFITRLFGITESEGLSVTKKRIYELVSEYIDHRHPGDFNQAVMEFGARICTPVNPDCNHCIFKQKCIALKINMVGKIPAKIPKPALHNRFISYLVIIYSQNGERFIFLNKRTGNDIWKNMFDFPWVEQSKEIKINLPMRNHKFKIILQSADFEYLGVSRQYEHLLTHQKLFVKFYRFHTKKTIDLPFIIIPLNQLHDYPIPKLIDRYLDENPL